MKKRFGAVYLIITLFIFLSVTLFINTSIYGANKSGVSKKQIKIGVIGDLTGPAANVGAESAAATRVLFKHINEQGGIHGRNLKVYIQDNHYDPVKTVAALKYLVSRHDVFAIVNVLGSTPMMAVFPMIAEEKIPCLPQINVSSKMYDPPKRYIFTNTTPGSEAAIVGLDYIVKDLKAKNPRLGIFYQDDEYGKNGLLGWKRAAEHYGFKLVIAESFKRGSTDVSSQAVSLRRANPEYVFLTGVGGTVLMLKEAKKLNWSPIFIGDKNLTHPKTIAIAGDAATGMCTVSDQAQGHESVPGVVELKKLNKKYLPKQEPTYANIWGWANTLILLEGLKRAGRDLTREGLVETLENFKNVSTKGLTGPVTYGPNDRKGGGTARVFKANIGKKVFDPVIDYRGPSITID